MSKETDEIKKLKADLKAANAKSAEAEKLAKAEKEKADQLELQAKAEKEKADQLELQAKAEKEKADQLELQAKAEKEKASKALKQAEAAKQKADKLEKESNSGTKDELEQVKEQLAQANKDKATLQNAMQKKGVKAALPIKGIYKAKDGKNYGFRTGRIRFILNHIGYDSQDVMNQVQKKNTDAIKVMETLILRKSGLIEVVK